MSRVELDFLITDISHFCLRNVCALFVLLRALSSFDGLDFGVVKQELDSARMNVASVDVASIDTCTELFAGRSWLSARDTLELGRHRLLRAVTALHVEDDLDHARLVYHSYVQIL